MDTDRPLRRKSDSLVRFFAKWAGVLVSLGILYGGMNKVIGFQFVSRGEQELFKKTNDIAHETMKESNVANHDKLKDVDNKHGTEIEVIKQSIKGVDDKVGVMIELQKDVLKELRRR